MSPGSPFFTATESRDPGSGQGAPGLAEGRAGPGERRRADELEFHGVLPGYDSLDGSKRVRHLSEVASREL